MDKKIYFLEAGAHEVLQNARRNKTRLFKPLKAQNKRRTLNIIFAEAQRNFRNKLFDSVEA